MASSTIRTLELQLIADVARLQKDMKQVQSAVGQMETSVAGSAARAGAAVTALGTRFQQTGRTVAVSSGQQRAAMQQLSFQIGDVATSFASGISPMVIFAQQGQQVVQALTLMRGGAGGLIGFLGGPWGAVLTGAVTILGTMIPKLLSNAQAMDEVKFASSAVGDAQRILGGVMDMTTGRINAQVPALLALARAQLLVARVDAQKRAADARRGVQAIQDRPVELWGSMMGVTAGRRPKDARDTISAQVLAGTLDGSTAVQRLENLRRVGKLTDKQFAEAAASVANLGVELENIKVFDSAERMFNGVGTKLDRKLLLSVPRAKAGGEKIGKAAGDAAADAFAEAMKLGLDRALDVMRSWNQKLALDADAEFESIIAQIGESHRSPIRDALDQEAEAVGALRDEYEKLAGVFDMLGSGTGAKTLRVLSGLSSGDFSGVGGKAGFLLNTLAGIQWTTYDENGRVIHKLGEEFADVLDGVFGKNGDFFKTLSQGAALGGTVGGLVFGGNKSAQLGSSIGGALGEVAGKAIGKKIGGLLGDAAGPLGAIAGGLLGGLVGGLFKKTKSGSATLGIGADGLGISSVGGNSGSRKQAATGLGKNVIGGLEAIADQLGGFLDGPISVSIGVRDKSIRVDPTGSGTTKTKRGAIDFGQDEEAAIKFAIADAIKDGAITGLRAGTMALLNAGDDVEKQLSKALKFQGVFDDLKQRLDPLGFAMDQISKETEQLQKIFKEAGATTAEYAQLEQLLALKREEAAEEARQKVLSDVRDRRQLEIQILELLGKKEMALAAARDLELLGLKDSLRPLQQWIYQLQDARGVIDTITPLLDDLKAYRAELRGNAGGGASFAFLRSQFGATAALAAKGDATALGQLRGNANAFLEAAKDNASSALDYQRALGQVLAAVDRGIFAADAKVDYAQLQIDAINAQTSTIAAKLDLVGAQQESMSADLTKLAKILDRAEADGLPVRTLAGDEPLQVEIAV